MRIQSSWEMSPQIVQNQQEFLAWKMLAKMAMQVLNILGERLSIQWVLQNLPISKTQHGTLWQSMSMTFQDLKHIIALVSTTCGCRWLLFHPPGPTPTPQGRIKGEGVVNWKLYYFFLKKNLKNHTNTPLRARPFFGTVPRKPLLF